MEVIFHWITQHGYLGIFSLLALGVFGIPIPDEGVLGFTGYLVYKGDLQLAPAVSSAFLGSVSGITLTYVLGRTAGIGLVKKYGHTFHVTDDKLVGVQAWFNRMGRWALLFGYFIPGVRQLMAFVAGISKLKFTTFALFTYTGGFLWSVTLVSIGYFFGQEWARLSAKIHHGLVIGFGVIVVSLLLYFSVKQKRHKRK